MQKIEEVTCIKFQEKNNNYHQELVLYNERSFDKGLSLLCFEISIKVYYKLYRLEVLADL